MMIYSEAILAWREISCQYLMLVFVLSNKVEINLYLPETFVCNSNFRYKNTVLFHTYTSFHFKAIFYCLY